MVPSIMMKAETNIERYSLPSRDYELGGQRLNGLVEKRDAVRQAVFFILNTQRYAHIIYPWSYGVELDDLIGQHKAYVIPEIERRVTEALLQDDRITSVDNFTFEQKRASITVRFTVHTIFGEIRTDKEVMISV